MRIHTNTIRRPALIDAIPACVHWRITDHRSHSHHHAFEVNLWGDPGSDCHGITRRYATGGAYGATDGRYRACTWVEWGDFICALFLLDETIKTRMYASPQDFIDQTAHAAFGRDFAKPQDNYPTHAQRWTDQLNQGIPSWATQRNASPATTR